MDANVIYNAWSKRDFSCDEEVPNPRPLVCYAVTADDTGKKKFVKTNPVKPSMACDYSVISNALLNRAGGTPYRLSTDPVDMLSKLENLID